MPPGSCLRAAACCLRGAAGAWWVTIASVARIAETFARCQSFGAFYRDVGKTTPWRHLLIRDYTSREFAPDNCRWQVAKPYRSPRSTAGRLIQGYRQFSSRSRRTAALSGFLHLSHDLRRAAAIRRIDPLRHDALKPHAADVLEDGGAVTRQMLNKPDGSPLGFAEQLLEPPLALDQWQVAQVDAIVLDQVEGVQHRLMAPALASERVEVRRAILVGNHRLAIDQERCGLDARAASAMAGKRSAQS